jgi:trk system potassium uptake protein TrkA
VCQSPVEHVSTECNHQGCDHELWPTDAVERKKQDDPGCESNREKPHEGEGEPHPAKSYNPPSVKVLIVGCGRVGSRLAANLSEDGHDVTVVDRDQAKLNLAASRGQLDPATFKGNVVLGDGTDAEVLRRAGVEAADAFIAVTEGDNRNIMASQIAQHVFKVPRVVCRIYDPVREEAYRKLGLSTYCPTVSGTEAIIGLLMEAD